MWAISVIFKNNAPWKQSPIGRKFAKSGHPGVEYLASRYQVLDPRIVSLFFQEAFYFCRMLPMSHLIDFFLESQLSIKPGWPDDFVKNRPKCGRNRFCQK
jgi:hypothetical protein